MSGKHMVYIGSYSYTGKAGGIATFDVDMKSETFRERCGVGVDGSSHITASSDGKTLYSIANERVVSFRTLRNGSLTELNNAPVRGMRGYYLCTDMGDKYVFVSGYHNGRTTVLSLNKDSSMEQIMDEMFNKEYGGVAEHSLRSYIIYTRGVPDDKYILSVNNGTDQVKVYHFNDKDKRLSQVDTIHCDLESAPRHFRYGSGGRLLHLIHGLQNVIYIHSHGADDRASMAKEIQVIPTTSTKNPGSLTTTCTMRLSPDERYAYCTNAGENIANIYSRGEKSGLPAMIYCLPVSDGYPEDAAIFPDQKHIVSISHDSGSINSFEVNYEKSPIVMCERSAAVNESNCCAIAKTGNQSEKIVGLMRQ